MSAKEHAVLLLFFRTFSSTSATVPNTATPANQKCLALFCNGRRFTLTMFAIFQRNARSKSHCVHFPEGPESHPKLEHVRLQHFDFQFTFCKVVCQLEMCLF